ncbi:MAG: SUMF1/EgtB/PvdO family nonheme iron enzyme [Leptolyngbya sp. SIO3F4]|nr:SUMF1/EgtB/PvdO family nonheme iron enzyme [Leptolyngbya sp. SIO3F4]
MSSRRSIFISYRREDSQAFTRKLYDCLAAELGPENVFRDLDSMTAGLPWRDLIARGLHNCQLLIAVIGSKWLNASRDGQRRLDNPQDWVRLEIEYAFDQRIPVIPLLVGDAKTLRADSLPGYWLKKLPDIQAQKIRDASPLEQSQIERLMQNINTVLKESKPSQNFQEKLSKDATLQMVHINGGPFWMGSPKDELDREKFEDPQHKVTVPTFYISKYPITQRQWYAVSLLPDLDRHLEPYPSHFKGEDLPVEKVSWYDAVEFCKRLSRKTGKDYRLPSEAEWEYVCRAETTTRYFFGDNLTTEEANFNKSKGKTTAVGSYPPNIFGLYDMHGNVWEWCQDHWRDNYDGAPKDGSAWVKDGYDNTKLQVLRGGSWACYSRLCRSAHRLNSSPSRCYDYLGFRVACSNFVGSIKPTKDGKGNQIISAGTF